MQRDRTVNRQSRSRHSCLRRNLENGSCNDWLVRDVRAAPQKECRNRGFSRCFPSSSTYFAPIRETEGPWARPRNASADSADVGSLWRYFARTMTVKVRQVLQ